MKLWDASKTKESVIEFCAGWNNKPRRPYDDRLIPYQLKLSRVYSDYLHRVKLIDSEIITAVHHGLKRLSKSYTDGKLTVQGYEDVQSLVESKLIEWYGNRVGSMHMGLSRNDQIVTLERMWMKDQIAETRSDLASTISVLDEEMKQKGKLVFPGYTHHRIAMPADYGELLKSYKAGLERDMVSLNQWMQLYNECPLGVGAGFGSPVNPNREVLARNLGFIKPTESNIDTVTTRWESETKLADAMKIMMTHLSTIAQDFIVYSMEGYDLISLPREYCTGSSIMPQKRNPDPLETIKRKAKTIESKSYELSNIGKGNISGYNRDTQGAKYAIMDVFDESAGCLDIISGIIKGVKVNEEKAKELLERHGAFSAAEAVRKSIEEGTPYRSTKLGLEEQMKSKKD
ncbi:hypothetical protein EPN87_03145 [archaeon]|nr:MAG: hypothetical protein EPN87_03145 [archaeon]